VRILLDECLPKRLARELPGHDARTVPDMGWAGLRNGDLLAVAQRQFDVFLTVDRNLSFQNDIHRFALAVVVLHAASNKLSDLRPLLPELLSKLPSVASGTVSDVGN
jgi:predicted nuclease of predicted toxin-antitoxin system